MINEQAYVPFSCVFNGDKMFNTMTLFTGDTSMYRHIYQVCLVKEDEAQLHVLGGFFIKTNVDRKDERYLSILLQCCSHLEAFDSASFLSLKLKIEGIQDINEEEGISLMKYQYQQLVNQGMTSFKGSVHHYAEA